MIVNSLSHTREDLLNLVRQIESGNVRCFEKVIQNDGDTRYWDLQTNDNQILTQITNLAIDNYYKKTGKPCKNTVLLYNVIDPTNAPNGSGGGWHRDSFKTQYKTFIMLSDVPSVEFGAFCILNNSNKFHIRCLSIILHLLKISHIRRVSHKAIKMFKWLGCNEDFLIGDIGGFAFCNTSLIHRGSPILKGVRRMITVYHFEDSIPSSVIHADRTS
jgi:hypothetical protein